MRHQLLLKQNQSPPLLTESDYLSTDGFNYVFNLNKYIPLFMLMPTPKDPKTSEYEESIIKNKITLPSGNVMSALMKGWIGSVHNTLDTKEAYKCFDNVVRRDIIGKGFINKNAKLQETLKVETASSGNSYEFMFSSLEDWRASYVNLRSANYITRFQFIYFTYVNTGSSTVNTGEILYTMVVAPEHLEYVRLCYLAEEDPHPSVIKILVNKKLLEKHRDCPYDPLRKKFKPILDGIVERGYELIPYDNINEDLFYIPRKPLFKSIGDKKIWLQTTAKELIGIEAVEQSCGRIVLEY